MSREKTNKVVNMFDDISFLEDEIVTIEEKLRSILEKKDDHEFILINMMFIDSTNNSDGKRKATSDNVDDMYMEVDTSEAIKILNTMLSDRKTKIQSIEKELETMFK